MRKLICALILGLACSTVGLMADDKQSRKVEKWEYKVVDAKKVTEELLKKISKDSPKDFNAWEEYLNKLGDEGWELTAFMPTFNDLIFK